MRSDGISMNTKVCIGVFFGGRSGENAVSLMSARSILSVLSPEKYNVIQIGITQEGRWLSGENVLEALTSGDTASLFPVTLLPDPGDPTLYVIRQSAAGEVLEPLAALDVAFPVLHGSFGEDGTIQGLFEMCGLAYVGAGVLGSAAAMDKALFKDVMRSHNLPVVESITVLSREVKTQLENVIERAEALASYPLFVKPVNLGSSVGVNKCRNREELKSGLLDAARYDRRVLIERGINAREIELSVLGNDEPIASIPGEIRPMEEFYSYNAKYIDARTELLIPASLEPDTIARFQELAVQAYRVIDCAGMARVDFLMDKETGAIYLSEINTIPGFTKISMYPKLWEASGISYPDLVNRLVALALERKAEMNQIERSYGSTG